MAQRRRADSRLARLAKTTSTRTPLLVLVVAALLLALSGCGGDDSDSETASATGAPGVEGPGGATPQQATGDGRSETPSSGSATPASSSRPGSGQQGSSVPIPKGAPEPGLTPQQREEATVASISLSSPAIAPAAVGSTARLPSTYTCDGKDTWPEIRWQGVPSDTVELALFAMSVKPVEGKIFFDWAVAGLDPELGGIEIGSLPKGAVMGRNGFGRIGYSICPVAGEDETYFFALYALTERLDPGKGFDPHQLRQRVLEASGNGGLMAASYGRQ